MLYPSRLCLLARRRLCVVGRCGLVSCGCRPALVPSDGSPLSPACLMSPPYASTLRSRHLIALVLGCVPSPFACLGSCLFPLSLASSSRRSCRPMASRYPPSLIDTTDGAIRRCCGCSLGFACLPLGSPSHPCVRHRMATGLGSCSRPMSIIGAACYPLARTIRFPRRPSSHRLSPRSLDTGDGAVVYLRGFCVLRRRWLPCLLGCRIIYFVDGGCGSATVRVRPLICLDAPVHPLFVMSSRISIPHLDAYSGSGYLLHPFICPGTCRFSFDVLCPVRLLTMADGARHFFMRIISAASWMKRRWLISVSIQSVRFCRSIGFSRPLCLGASAGASCSSFHFCLLAFPMMSCRHRIQCRPCPPHRGYTCHVIRSSCGLASLCLPLCLSLRLSYRIASLRFALSPRSSCRRAGRCHAAGVDCLLSLSVRCGIRSAAGCAAHFVMSAMRRCPMSIAVGVVISSWPWLPCASADVMRSAPLLRACLPHPISLARRSVSLCGSFPRRLVSSPRLLVSMSGERLVACHVSRHPSLWLCLCVSDVMLGVMRLMDEMMSRQLLASFLFFLFRPPPSCPFSSVCLL